MNKSYVQANKRLALLLGAVALLWFGGFILITILSL